MIPAVYERKKAGIIRVGHPPLGPVRGPYGTPETVGGTPWTLLHEERWRPAGDTAIKFGDRVRLSNPERETDVLQIDVEFSLFRFRFFTLDQPSLRVEGTRLGLYDHDLLVAQHIHAWRDREVAAGILSRVETTLEGPAADAAAILLFHLEERPLVANSGRIPEPTRPLGF